MFRKIFKSLIILFFLLLIYTVNIDAEERETLNQDLAVNFVDVVENQWYYKNVEELYSKGIINGYEDKTFRPQNLVSKAQFLKMVLVSMGYTDIKNDSEYWAKGYIEKAYELDLINERYSQKVNYDEPIDRGNMASIIAKVVKVKYNNEDIIMYSDEIKDFEQISGDKRLAIIQVYKSEIIKGYPDRTFKAENKLTRAETSTVIVRLLEKIKDIPMPQTVSGSGGN